MSDNKNTKVAQNFDIKTKDDFLNQYDKPNNLKRIDRKYILSELVNVLNFNKGIFYTIKELSIRPGKSIKHFIQKDRSKFVKPISFVILCSIIYTIAQQYLINKDFLNEFGRGHIDSLGLKKSALINTFDWTKRNYGYTNILISIFIVFWIKLFFKKLNYNFYEILTFILYVLGFSTLIYSSFIVLEIITDLRLLFWGGIVGFIYSSWAIGQIDNKSKFINYFKGSAANLFGIITFYFIIIIFGSAIDLIALNIK